MQTTTNPAHRTRQLLRHLLTNSSTSTGTGTGTGTMAGPVTGICTSPAPWRSTFLSHVKGMESPSFTLSTLHHPGLSSQKGEEPRVVVPRARTVIFRGMWASLPVNPKNTAELNPTVFESDFLTITTDVRMEKVPELLSGNSPEETSQSGIGGPVEAVFWAPKHKTQWRIRGNAYVIGPDIDSKAGAPVRDALKPLMRSTAKAGGEEEGDDEGGKWSWSKELTAHFGNLSPTMRGTFKNPPPGRPRSEEPEPGLKLGQKVEDLYDVTARRNFRVLIIKPEEVEQVNLTDPDDGRRWSYSFEPSEEGGAWKTTELWP